MRQYRQPTRADWLTWGLWIAAYVAAMSASFIVYWPLGFLVAFAGLIALIALRRRMVGYRCPHCGETFEISFSTDFISPHGIGRDGTTGWRSWKYLRCPHCGRRSRATALVVADGGRSEERSDRTRR